MLSLIGSGAVFLSCQGISSHGGRVGSVRRFVCADCRVEPGNDSVCGRRDFFVAGVNFPIRIFDSESTKRVKRPAFLR